MSITELIAGLNKNDSSIKKHLFDSYFGKLMAISLRYSKNDSQASEAFNVAFNVVINNLKQQKPASITDLDSFIEVEFIKEVVAFIKNIRSEYYVASTVYATGKDTKNYDLFDANDLIDYSTIDSEILVKSLQQLVPSQRLIFNLNIIEGYTLEDSSAILEASEQTAKSNLEKARFNLQKNIEKCLKTAKYEQSF